MSDTIGKINIDNISKFAELMMDLQDTGYCPMFCKYDVARNLIKELIRHGADIRYILLDDNDGGGYTKEFEVGLVDNEIVCVQVYDMEKHKYLGVSGDIVFVHEDCNSKFLTYIDSDEIYEVEFDCDNDCEKCDENDTSTYILDDYEEYDSDDIKCTTVQNTVIKGHDGMPNGFTHSVFGDNDDGIYTSSYCSYFSDDFEDLKRAAKLFDIVL